MSKSWCFVVFLCLICVCRFIGVVILKWIDPALLLTIYAACCTSFCVAVSQTSAVTGIVCLYFLFFFESICYPVSLASFPISEALLSCTNIVAWPSSFHMLNHPLFAVHFHLGYEELGSAYKEGVWPDRHGCRRWCMVSACTRSSGGSSQHTSVLPCAFIGLHGYANLRRVSETQYTRWDGLSLTDNTFH